MTAAAGASNMSRRVPGVAGFAGMMGVIVVPRWFDVSRGPRTRQTSSFPLANVRLGQGRVAAERMRIGSPRQQQHTRCKARPPIKSSLQAGIYPLDSAWA